ncbi:MAG TPA: DUF998 domain-containing protein [Solirubrobacteraceae bacterium]
MEGRGIVQTFSIVAAIAAATQAAALIALHLLPTGYNPKLDAVSDYGIGRYRGVFWTQTLAGAVACVALAVGLSDAKPSMPTLAIVLLVIAGIARLLIPVFPTDKSGSRFQTAGGTIHMILAVVIFAAIIVAASKLGSALEHRPAWHGVKGWLTTLPWIMTGAAVGVLVALRGPRLKRIFGLFERLFYVSSLAWFLIVSIELAHIGH